MPTDQIVALLIVERDRLSAAIKALGGVGHDGPFPMYAPKKRHVSAAVRRKMAAGQKKRWAKIKSAK